jgi:hypothetical protein
VRIPDENLGGNIGYLSISHSPVVIFSNFS